MSCNFLQDFSSHLCLVSNISFWAELNINAHTPLKYKFVFFLTPGTSFSVRNMAKHTLFKIVIVNRSRKDFAISSIYCNSIANRGQEEQVPSQQTLNQNPNAKKNKNPST